MSCLERTSISVAWDAYGGHLIKSFYREARKPTQGGPYSWGADFPREALDMINNLLREQELVVPVQRSHSYTYRTKEKEMILLVLGK